MKGVYESVAKAVCNVRASAPLGADWSDNINADYQKRGRKSKKNWFLVIVNHIFRGNFFFVLPLLWTNFRTRKCTNTKFTRKKDEESTKDTRNFRIFRPNRGQNHRAKTARWFMKNQWSKLDHWKPKGQNDPMKSKAQKEPLVWLKTNHTTSCQDGARLKLYRRLRRGGTQKCHLVIFSKNLLTKSDLCVILL